MPGRYDVRRGDLLAVRGMAAWVMLCALGAGAADPVLPAEIRTTPRAPCLRDFSGAVNIPGGGLWHTLGVGWGRHDFSWDAIEPRQDEWRFANYDEMVLAAHRHGEDFLPMLGYCARWAVGEGAPGVGPPESVADWEDFVETVVARYSRPPFNLRYFQVWNEPTIKAGFWKGKTDAEWFEKIYLPAARIIKRYGCEVVFGGWPCSDGIESLCKLLDEYEAWRWTDILDIHYYSLAAMVNLHERYVKTGKCKGIWQTEVGWHGFEEYLPNLYCRTLYWGLREGWDFGDQFKLFWYAFWGAGPDGIKCLTLPGAEGSQPSPTHGVRLRVLNQVLGGAQLAAFDRYTTRPELAFTTDEEVESSQGFLCGRRIVIAFQVSPQTQAAHATLALSVELAAPPREVTRWNSTGDRRVLEFEYTDGRVEARIPLEDMPAGTARNWGREVKFVIGYVVIE